MEKEGAVALGESYRRLPGSMGDVPRQKLTQGQLRKHRPKPQVSVPHLVDLHKIPSLAKPMLLAGLRKKDKDVAKAPD